MGSDEQQPRRGGKGGARSGRGTPAWFDPSEVYVKPLSAAEAAAARTEPTPTPVWPVVIGMVSLILGLLSAGVHAALLATPALLRKVERLGYLELPPEAALPPMEPTATAQANAVARIAVALLLALAGVFTLARKRAGACLHLVYGGLGLIVGVWGLWEGAQARAALAAWAAENPDALAGRFLAETSVLSTVMAATLALAWPVFTLAWFGARRQHRTQLGRVSKPAR